MKMIKAVVLGLAVVGLMQSSCVANKIDESIASAIGSIARIATRKKKKDPIKEEKRSILSIFDMLEVLKIQSINGMNTVDLGAAIIKTEKKMFGFSIQYECDGKVCYLSPKDLFLCELALRMRLARLEFLRLKRFLPGVNQTLKTILPIVAAPLIANWALDGNMPSVGVAGYGLAQAAGLYGLGHYCGWGAGVKNVKASPKYKEMTKVYSQKKYDELLAAFMQQFKLNRA